ncbi:MAG: hypothetical protein AMXMBFR7_10900 [Planctomycetota bacterium]
MPRNLLSPLAFGVLDALVRDGAQSVAALYVVAEARWKAEPADLLKALQDLYDYSFVDVRDRTSGGTFRDRLTPDDWVNAYRHLDCYSAVVCVARGGTEDPFELSASHLGIAEHAHPPESSEPGAKRLPPEQTLPTLPFE